MTMFQQESGNWIEFRSRFNITSDREIDLHFGRRDPFEKSYVDVMSEVAERVREALIEAQRHGDEYVMFRHGWSTSRPGEMTARSVVRGFMRSKEATPFIVRSG